MHRSVYHILARETACRTELIRDSSRMVYVLWACRIRQVNVLRLLEMDTQPHANYMDAKHETSSTVRSCVDNCALVLHSAETDHLKQGSSVEENSILCEDLRTGVCKVAACVLKAMALYHAIQYDVARHQPTPHSAL